MFANKKPHQTDILHVHTHIYIYIYIKTHIIISLTFPTYFTHLYQGISKKMSSTLILENEKNGVSGHPGASRPCCYEAAVQKRFNGAADAAEVGVTRRTFVLWSYPYGVAGWMIGNES